MVTIFSFDHMVENLHTCQLASNVLDKVLHVNKYPQSSGTYCDSCSAKSLDSAALSFQVRIKEALYIKVGNSNPKPTAEAVRFVSYLLIAVERA